MDRLDLWTHIFQFITKKYWSEISLVSKNANKGLHKMMMIKYGKVNTWIAEVPLFIHKWKCEHHPKGSMIINVSYPYAFETPETTKLKISYPKCEILDKKYFLWEDLGCLLDKRRNILEKEGYIDSENNLKDYDK
jgi:hypothetical protein